MRGDDAPRRRREDVLVVGVGVAFMSVRGCAGGAGDGGATLEVGRVRGRRGWEGGEQGRGCGEEGGAPEEAFPCAVVVRGGMGGVG